MSICYWNQRKHRTPVLEIERLPASAPKMHQMDSSFSLTNLPCSSDSLRNSRCSHRSPIRANAPRRLLPPEYYSDFSDSESDSSSSDEERVNLRLRHQRIACVLPPSVIPAKKNVDRDWRAYMNTCVIPSLTSSHSDQSLSPDQFPSIQEVSPPPSPSQLSPLSLPSLVIDSPIDDSLSFPPSVKDLSPFDSNSHLNGIQSPSPLLTSEPLCLPAPACSPCYSSDFDEESEYDGEENDEMKMIGIEDVEVNVPSSPSARSIQSIQTIQTIPTIPTIEKEILTVAQILNSLRRSDVPNIVVHQPEDLPEVDEDLPEVDEDLPEVDEDLPEVDEDLPEVAEDLPEVAESKEDVKTIALSMVNEIFAEVKENLSKEDDPVSKEKDKEDIEEKAKPVKETEYVGSLRRWPFSSFLG